VAQAPTTTGFKLINRRQTINNKDNLLKVINYKASANGSLAEITLNCANSKIAKTLTRELNKIATTEQEEQVFQLPATEDYSSPFHIEEGRMIEKTDEFAVVKGASFDEVINN
jgi:hypothetical protein